VDKPKALLHICCGICASWSIEKLKMDGYEVTGFFYNPNIEPREEYDRRQQVAANVCRIHGVAFIEGTYDNGDWQRCIAGLEREPEGGLRCHECFRFRLAAAAGCARDHGISHFTTTLTISPHKNAGVINNIGKTIAPQAFLMYNLKKEDGFKKANIFARDHGLYRQHYCGCRYSMANREAGTKGR